METKTPKPQYISYVRYAKNREVTPTKEAHTAERRLVYVLLGYGALLLLKAAYAYPGTAMFVISIIGVAYSIVQGIKLYARRNEVRAQKHKILVHELNKTKVIYL